MSKRFKDRTEAGRRLAQQLSHYANRADVLVLGLPRGGVPVAYEIAKSLNVVLDICLVRKLGVPKHPELAMGAIASNVRILNKDVIDWLNISDATIENVMRVEQQELQRRDRAYRTHTDNMGSTYYPPVPVDGKTLIVVDDGIATGSTLRAAINLLRQQNPAEIVVAVPVAPPSTCQDLQTLVDDVVCLMTPERLGSIGIWYEDFSQLSDEEVCQLLERASQFQAAV